MKGAGTPQIAALLMNAYPTLSTPYSFNSVDKPYKDLNGIESQRESEYSAV